MESWKKAFISLLSLNILLVMLPVGWYLSLPRIPNAQTVVAASGQHTADVHLDLSDESINPLLETEIAQRPNLGKVLSYADVSFKDYWTCNVGIKLDNQVAPFQVTFLPTVTDGNVDLQILDATMNGAQMTDTLENIMNLIPLPGWIRFDSVTNTLQLNLAQLPEHKVTVQAVDYSPKTRRLEVLLIPNLPH